MMQILFDSSVLVAGMLKKHAQHDIALHWFKKEKEGEFNMVVASHSLLETYSVLTRLPLTPKISPDIAKKLIVENISKTAETVALPSEEYFSLLQDCAEQYLSGGVIYDALIFKTACFAKVDHLLTFNTKDFIRFAAEKQNFILNPLSCLN